MDNDLSFAVPFSSSELLFNGMKIHFHRNISGYLFPSKINEGDKAKASAFILSNLKNQFAQSSTLAMPISHEIKESLPDISSEVTGCMIDSKNCLSFSVFDQDHLIVTLHTHQTDLKKLIEQIKKIELELGSSFNFATSKKMGLLTSTPEFSGLGISIGAYLFCPSLELISSPNPRFGLESYWQHEGFYLLKTINTVNIELPHLLKEFLETINQIKKQAKKAQEALLKLDKDKITDQVAKSLALLKGAYQLNYKETLNHLLSLKMGYHLDLLNGIKSDSFLKLLQQAQKGHLSAYFKQKESSDDWLHERATWIRKELENVELNVK